MKRRDFMLRSAGSVMLGAAPLGAAAAWHGALLDDPQSWIGREFRLADGSQLALAAVEPVANDRDSIQMRLQFRVVSGSTPREGSHALSCGFDEETLFLQPGRDGPVACLNRLKRDA
ncbi:MAG: hypothetical protein ACT4NL_10905 [Pseudomarimonas sp.]